MNISIKLTPSRKQTFSLYIGDGSRMRFDPTPFIRLSFSVRPFVISTSKREVNVLHSKIVLQLALLIYEFLTATLLETYDNI